MTWSEIRLWLAAPEPIWQANGQPLKTRYRWLTIRQLRARLRWQYGKDRARAILMGADLATENDRLAWSEFGSPKGLDAA